MTPVYQVSRKRRVIDLLSGPTPQLAGLAIPVYLGILFTPRLREGVDFLHQRGALAYLGALPILILVTFFAWFGWACLRGLLRSWADALSIATRTREGLVTGVSSTPSRGGTVNRLSIEGHLYTSLPPWTIARLKAGERLRIVSAPRTDYVVSIERISPAPGEPG